MLTVSSSVSIAGGAPYPLIDSMDELFKVLKSGYRLERPENCSPELHHIMRHCWNKTPSKRPTFTELREHLEKLMEDTAQYFSLSIDFTKAYYNVASFNSVEEEDEEIFDKDYYDRPIQFKVVADTKTNVLDTAIDLGDVDETTDVTARHTAQLTSSDDKCDLTNMGDGGVARYISQGSFKSSPVIDHSRKVADVGCTNDGFHYSE